MYHKRESEHNTRGHMATKFLVFLLGASLASGYDNTQGPIAETEYGKVRGTVKFAIGSPRPVYSYFGIKYGRSPDYVFRFRPAEDPWAWDGVRDATDENRPLCVQDREKLKGLRRNTYFKHLIPQDPEMKEDCLFVDVFSPQSPNATTAHSSLPVIVWLHGGSFQAFCSTTKLWALSAYEDVVLVQVQYRVGLFGFLTTDDEWAPPNSALKDHIKALQWVQRNIKAFGGDPSRVTIMGESAGAIAVTSHMLSPASTGLFHRAFATSGAPNSMIWSCGQSEATIRMANASNCLFGDNASTSTCMRNKISTNRMMKLAKDSKQIFSLQIDENIMPSPPTKLIETKSFATSVPLMLGIINGEVNYLLPRRVFSDIYFKGEKVTRSDTEGALRTFLSEHFADGDVAKVFTAVVKEYMSRDKVGDQGVDLFQGFLEAIGDCWFVSKAARFAEKLKESGQHVYFFEFTHKSSMYTARAKEFARPYDSPRADHADDLLYAFGLPFVSELAGGTNPPLYFTDLEKGLSRKYMKVLSHFAATGSPPMEIQWPEYPKYADVGDDFRPVSEDFNPDRMDLWNEIIPSLAYGG